MSTSIISGDDLRYFVQQSPAQLTTIMGQMTTLIQDITDTQNDTNERVESMEKQGWFKRMWATVSGKNKATKAEIQRNQDKVVSYVSQAVAQCYQMNCIDQQAICSLGNRMNQVYSQVNEFYSEQLQMKAQIAEIQLIQQQTLQALGGFVTQLNEKIESVDSFHMLITEIQQGRYSDSSKLYSLCNILAQLDKRTLDDSRKIGILKDALLQSKIIDDAEMSISEYLMHILSLPEDKIGVMYLELCNFRNSFPANLFADMIENYHFLSKMEKMSKKKETIVQKLLDKYELDESAEFSIDDISESFFENKQASLVNAAAIQIDMNDNMNSRLFSDDLSEMSYDNLTPEMLSKISEEIEEGIIEIGFGDGKRRELFEYLKNLADKGNPTAQNKISRFYLYGDICCDVDEVKAFKYLKASADKGLADATDSLADIFEEWYNYDMDALEEVFPHLEIEDYSEEALRLYRLAYQQALEQNDDFLIKHIPSQIGEHYKNDGDYEKALSYYMKADLSDPAVQTEIGECYLFGRNDEDEAVKWLEKAMLQEYPQAYYGLGMIAQKNDDEYKAFACFEKATERGFIAAQYELGLCYRLGKGVAKNCCKAFDLFKELAEDYNEEGAQNQLGIMFDNGEHVQQDYHKAVKWYKKAADQGLDGAKYNLALCYYYGTGVAEDKDYARDLLEEIAEEGYESAQEFLDENF